MKGRMIKSAVALAASIGAYGAISVVTASANVPAGYTEVAQSSQTYTPGGDVGTFCDAAASGKGFGGGCFTPSYTATYVDATLTDQATQKTAGEIQFNSGATNGSSLGTVDFCGDSGPVAIPTGTTNIFVTAAGPILNAIGPSCGTTSFATTGTVTLTQLVRTATTTTTTTTTTS